MKVRNGVWVLSLMMGILARSVIADEKDFPILTVAVGPVSLFLEPRPQPHDSVPAGAFRVKYEGRFYLSRSVRVGDALPTGAWLRTLPGARARVVFTNGDQLNVGPSSFIKLESSKSGEAMDISYGLVRSIISKSGPRNRLRVRTFSATMGVRGTDFVVESRPSGMERSMATSLTLIRGSVELTPQGKQAPQTVKMGQTAFVAEKKPVETFATSRVELKRVTLLTEKPSNIEVPVPQELASSILELEKKARDVSVTDILAHAASAEEWARLETLIAKRADVQILNQEAVAMRIEQAPERSPGLDRLMDEAKRRTKRSARELQELEKDPYGLYFEGTQSD